MKSAFNRQALSGEVNPLFSKYVSEGANPSTYITAGKRREIYDYMSQTNYAKHQSKFTSVLNCNWSLFSLGPSKPTKTEQQENQSKTAA